MQQAMDYAQCLMVPFVFTSNGDGFTFHNPIDCCERLIGLNEFPCSADMYPLDVYIDAGFLLYYLLSDVFTYQVLANETRVKMPKTNQEELNKVLIPLPPLSE